MGRVKQAARVNEKLAGLRGEGAKKTNRASKSEGEKDQQRKKHRKRSGTRALMDIRKYQGMTHKRKGKADAATALLIPRESMSRLIRETLQDVASENGESFSISSKAVDEIHTAAEAMITAHLAGAQSLAQHRGAVSVERKDLRMFNYCHECPSASISAVADPLYNQQQVSWLPSNKVSSVDIHALNQKAW